MAQIINFPSARRSRPVTDMPPENGAEILFFLGVRYVRTDAPAQPQLSEKTTRRTRTKRA
jgi:hypothetical protein